MKPIDIYRAPAITTSTELYPISHFLPDVDVSNDGLDAQDRVTVITHYNPFIDGSRHASLYSVRYMDKPFMVCKTGGRPDYEHYRNYITDLATYREALAYLKSLEKIEPREDLDICNENDEVDSLDIVYSTRISLADLGPIAQARHWMAKWFYEWPHYNPWPYPCDFPEKPTLADKQAKRWPRIKAEIESHIQKDSAAIEIAKLARKHEVGTDDLVKQMLKMLEALPPEYAG